ncbi:flagellar basal body-associated FliL family protein [Pararoseomonas indoligenes]|uniref:Flagellar protein FliL n=1 Tax=Roseomonas indoligenes TaxID=2820811 RepID=A0A940MWI4_9PROT|nr:flagellar basal body-associated FliL family protein [Pararoseomonas indoligenes]MBP0492497.1 flagellar basal body-associated FliL family protein [Pararoseomonas indoligenes]
MAHAAALSADGAAAPKKGGRKKLVLLALPLLLGGAGAGLWFSGLLPFGKAAEHGEEHAAAPAGHGAPALPQQAARPPVFLDLPEVLTNLNVTGRRATFIRLKAKLELASEADAAAVQAAMPRLLDLFQTYLREMRPEELRGSQGTYRLREELRNRASLAASAAKIQDVLFIEMIVQ